MEQARLRMDEVEQLGKDELLQRMRVRYAKHAKSCRLHAIVDQQLAPKKFLKYEPNLQSHQQ